jgi:hypothetical protein
VFKNIFTFESLIYYYFKNKILMHISTFLFSNIQENRQMPGKVEKNLLVVLKNLPKWTLNMQFFNIIGIKSMIIRINNILKLII